MENRFLRARAVFIRGNREASGVLSILMNKPRHTGRRLRLKEAFLLSDVAGREDLIVSINS